MTAVSISANLDERDANRLRILAAKEHRSVSNVVANAVAVFTDLPKDLRDSLLELRVDEDPLAFQKIAREMSAMVARAKLDRAFQRLAEQDLLPDVPDDATDLEMLDHASKLCRGV